MKRNVCLLIIRPPSYFPIIAVVIRYNLLIFILHYNVLVIIENYFIFEPLSILTYLL